MNNANVRLAVSHTCIEIDCSARADETQISDEIAEAVATAAICSVCIDFSERAILSTRLLDEIDRWIRLGLEVEIQNLEPHLLRVSHLDA